MKRLLVTMIASEVERVRAPERASETAAAEFLRAILRRELTEREELLARAGELSLEVGDGASVIVARAHPQAPTDEGWRARVRAVAERGARAVVSRSIAALSERDGRRRLVRRSCCWCPAARRRPRRAPRRRCCARWRPASRATRSRSGAAASPRIPPTCRAPPARPCSRPTSPQGGADGAALAFEQTGAYRLLLSAMSENPSELQRFYAETVEPLRGL